MKLIKYLTVFIFAITFFACNDDFLEMTPSSNLGDQVAITSIGDLQKATYGAYNYLTDDDLYDGDAMLWGDLASEDWMNPEWSSGWQDDSYNYRRTKIAAPIAIFKIGYDCITHINNVLAKGAELGMEDDNEYKQYVAELRAIRALMHFEIVKLYGPLPATLGHGSIKPDALGIYISDKVIADPFATFLRGKVSDNYTWIISEFEAAIPNMTVAKYNGFMNQWAAKGLLARVCLYAGQYSKALGLCQDIITKSPYSLYERNEYVNAWTQEFTSESLFELKVSVEDNNEWNCLGYYVRGNSLDQSQGYKEVMATVDFVNFIEDKDNDIRKSLIFFDDVNQDGVWEMDSKEGYYPSLKYAGREGNYQVNNPKIIRLSEIYLIAAECNLKPGGNTAQAVNLINTLRSKRIDGYESVSSVTIEDILSERRMELFAEGHRSYDLRRNLKDIVRYTSAAEKITKGHNDELEGLPNGIIPFDYYRHLLPITERELNLLDADVAATQQNPGY